MASFGLRIQRAVQPRPDGLLFHQLFVFGLLPLHVGIRQYWLDFDALERWVRSEPHRSWWRELLRGGSGTAFWHETYFMRGGMEAIFLDLGPGLAPPGYCRVSDLDGTREGQWDYGKVRCAGST